MKILVCGDSFCVTDPDYPGLHWSEKILNSSSNFELCNLSVGGASNALIAIQLMQGLKLKPDFVILSFTNEHRYEKDNNIDAMPYDLSVDSISEYLKERYSSNPGANMPASAMLSTNLEKIKNYFYIVFCLQILKEKQINFCFSLGGFEFKQDYSAFINSNFMENLIIDFKGQELLTNLWYYINNKNRPYFHVDNESVQRLFANQCLSHIGKVEQ